MFNTKKSGKVLFLWLGFLDIVLFLSRCSADSINVSKRKQIFVVAASLILDLLCWSQTRRFMSNNIIIIGKI